VAADPGIASANPVVITADPDESGLRRNADHFDLRRRRSDGDDSTVIARRGCNHAAAEKGAGQKGDSRHSLKTT
jgi:hypothetical protein